ncbi:MAG: hypothetical protein MK105_12390 [Crocinitomicaceae bacterium]|nr:hypothetical protein [Crocinitomicaceae bacterium]
MRILFLLLFFVSIPSLAQRTEYILKPESGSFGPNINMTAIRQSTDSIPRLNFWTGGYSFPTTGITFCGLSYFVPRQILISADWGFGGNLEANGYLINWEKTKTVTQSVNAGIGVRYVTSIPVQRLRSIGLHFGTGYSNQGAKLKDYTNHGFITYGVNLLGAKHAHWLIESHYGQRKGSSSTRLCIEGIYYYNPSYFPTSSEDVVRDNDPLAGTYQPSGDYYISETEYLEEKLTESTFNGFQIYVDGYVSLWSKSGIVGFKYKLGYGTSLTKSTDNRLIIGGGLNFTFL